MADNQGLRRRKRGRRGGSASDRPRGLSSVAVLGKTGVGKSTTLNGLCGLMLPTDDALPCTREPWSGTATLQVAGAPRMRLRVVDLPGIGEGLEHDRRYLPWYHHWLARADHVLWLQQANVRCYTDDQMALLAFKSEFRPGVRFTLGLCKVDVLPGDDGGPGFDPVAAAPLASQATNLKTKVGELLDVFNEVLSDVLTLSRGDVVPYTVRYGWGMDRLAARLALPGRA